jgi:predicted ATPase
MDSKYSSSVVSAVASTHGFNIALTGGPSVGKTTMADWLSSVGFIVRPEMASVLIQATKKFLNERGLELSNDPVVVELCREHGLFHPMVDNPAFQLALFTQQLEQEDPYVKRLLRDLVVFDRTYLDGIAYCDHYGVELPDVAKNVIPSPAERYDLCFLLESFNGFEDNGIRVEKPVDGADFAKIIGPRLGDIYRNNGVKVISVPAFTSDTPEQSIEARKQFMWKHIHEYAIAKMTRCGR